MHLWSSFFYKYSTHVDLTNTYAHPYERTPTPVTGSEKLRRRVLRLTKWPHAARYLWESCLPPEKIRLYETKAWNLMLDPRSYHCNRNHPTRSWILRNVTCVSVRQPKYVVSCLMWHSSIYFSMWYIRCFTQCCSIIGHKSSIYWPNDHVLDWRDPCYG
jgi:hypothetical protein